MQVVNRPGFYSVGRDYKGRYILRAEATVSNQGKRERKYRANASVRPVYACAAPISSFSRKTNNEGRALAFFGFEGKLSSVFIHNDGTRNRQPLAGSLARFFGGKKRIKNAGLNVPGNSRAGVLNPDFSAFAAVSRSHPDFSLADAAVAGCSLQRMCGFTIGLRIT